MKRHQFTITAVAAAFALSTLPALAQEKGGGGSSRPSGGAESRGTATPRSGGEAAGGGSAVSRGGGGAESGSSSNGGGMSGGSMGSSSSPSVPSSSGFGMAPARSYDRAPQRSASAGQSSRSSGQAGSRSNGGQSSGRSAVPRGSSSGSEGSGSVRSGGSTTSREAPSGSGGSADRSGDSGRRAVPAYSRPRDGRPVTGAAVERGTVPRNGGGDVFFIYRPYYYPYGFWGSNYGFGLGYLYYDPFWYGGYSPYGYGYGGYGYGGSGYGGGYSSGGYSQTYRDTGNLRLKIKPREAQVFVDGYFVGVVDSFDGTFQRLSLDGGGHKVEVKADGYEPLQLDVLITPGETVTYKGEMKRIQ